MFMYILTSQVIQIPCVMQSPIWASQSECDTSIMTVMLDKDRKKGITEQISGRPTHHRRDDLQWNAELDINRLVHRKVDSLQP